MYNRYGASVRAEIGKTWLVVKHDHLPLATEIFTGSGVNMPTESPSGCKKSKNLLPLLQHTLRQHMLHSHMACRTSGPFS